MSYFRVIPRDLFNEANLLKCYGRIYINLENENIPDVELQHDGSAFDVCQDEATGAIYVANVQLLVRGSVLDLRRALNSRDSWPLVAVLEDYEEVVVFQEDGSFTAEMLELLRGH